MIKEFRIYPTGSPEGRILETLREKHLNITYR